MLRKIPFTAAYLLHRSEMEYATQIYYDIDSHELTFEVNEAPYLLCDYAESVSGTHDELRRYYEKSLRAKFAHGGIHIK